jgi:hypothetical protein
MFLIYDFKIIDNDINLVLQDVPNPTPLELRQSSPTTPLFYYTNNWDEHSYRMLRNI